ncbi:hypothetical protein [Methanospirillum lacunae]|uniref:Uncharacterized protein n=1 Tax=Methanospirillum lacunae TaxID=668570 RepID=A0A2V2N5M1_9EURY|nr:hypothetical protein DK846_05545 [Methanospirillum lacunae]
MCEEEIEIDISNYRSKTLIEFFDLDIDIVVTAYESVKTAGSMFPGTNKIIHASFPDPSVETETEED